ncbi:MAG: MarR family winged helix-turn-helix transcriptional regulator [Sphingobacteriaceae bacterium]
MDDIVQLVTRWAEFKKVYSKGTVEEFHRFELAKRDNGALASEHIKGDDPQSTSNRFMKVIARLHLAYNVYLRIALKDTPLAATEKFVFLAALNVIGESSKTQVISYAMMEMSTGGDILNRLLKDNFIAQRNDPNDKRSKLISITDKGIEVLQQCFEKTAMVRKILLQGLTEDEEKICVQILYPIQEKHTKLAVESKNKSIEEILNSQLTDKKRG